MRTSESRNGDLGNDESAPFREKSVSTSCLTVGKEASLGCNLRLLKLKLVLERWWWMMKKTCRARICPYRNGMLIALSKKKKSHWCSVRANLILGDQVGLQVFLKSFFWVMLSQNNRLILSLRSTLRQMSSDQITNYNASDYALMSMAGLRHTRMWCFGWLCPCLRGLGWLCPCLRGLGENVPLFIPGVSFFASLFFSFFFLK